MLITHLLGEPNPDLSCASCGTNVYKHDVITSLVLRMRLKLAEQVTGSNKC